MQQTTNQALTKKDVEEIVEAKLKPYVTKADLKQLDKKLNGRMNMLDGRIDRLDEKVDRLDEKVDRLDEKVTKIDDNARLYRDEILGRMDDIAGQLEAMREDSVIGAYQTEEIRKIVNDHEKRINHLEQPAL